MRNGEFFGKFFAALLRVSQSGFAITSGGRLFNNVAR
jgi:hypothetical protein